MTHADGTKISDLSIATTGDPTADFLEVVKDPAGSPVNYKMTWHDFLMIAQPDLWARVYNSGNLTIPTATPTALTFDSEREDAYGFHSTVSNTSRLTIPTGLNGLYILLANCEFDNHVDGDRQIRLVISGGTEVGRTARWPKTGVYNTMYIAAALYWLTAGQYAEAQVYQNRGGDLDVMAVGNYSPEFCILRVGRSP